MSEREDERRFPRLASTHAVLVKTLSGEGLEEIAPTRSIALGGCSLICDEAFGADTPVELMISVAHGVIAARGRVVYERPTADGRSEVGIEFAPLDREAAAAIRQLFETPPPDAPAA